MEAEPIPFPGAVRHGASERDTARHTLTVKQAADLFTQLGSPRSARSVQRFCEQNLIDAISVTRENGTPQYFIDPQSVERYAAELKQLQDISNIGNDVARHDTLERDTARHDTPKVETPPMPEPAPTIDHEKVELQKRIGTLEQENVQLQIDNRARVVVINQMAEERRGFFEQLTEKSREIGRLETRLEMLLEAPKDNMARHSAPSVEEPIVIPIVEEGRGVVDPGPGSTPVTAREPRPGFFRRVFGGQ